MANPLDEFPLFQDAVFHRLTKGRQEYGDRSFTDADLGTLLREIQEELLDVSGWAYIMWRKLVELEGRLPDADPEPPRE